MEVEQDIKLSSTKKIFNIRRLPYKQFDNQKFLKENYSPLHADRQLKNGENQRGSDEKSHNKFTCMEYYYQLTLTSSPVYKQLQAKYKALKERHKQEKEAKLRILREKQKQLEKFISERKKIAIEQERLLRKREELCYHIEKMREQREMEAEIRGEDHLTNIRDMLIGMHYQGGVDINPDNMTYEQLLQLQEKMGKVSKGLNEQQYKQLQVTTACKSNQDQLCSICYYNVKQGQQIHKLPCKHIFHCDCIREWLAKERVCPMCKQQIVVVVEGVSKQNQS